MAGQSSSLGSLIVDLFLQDAGFQSGLKKAEGQLKASGGSMTAVAEKVSAAVSGAFKAMGVAAAAFAASSVLIGASFEQQMAKVAAISGATGADFDALRNQARALGASTEFTATQAGQGLEALARAGLSVTESIGASNAALLLASTSGASLEDSANLTAATMRQFGLDSSQTTRIMDVFSKAMRSSLLDFSSIREAMKFAGTAGTSFGMSLEETTAAVAAFRNLGLEGSMAGNALKMSMIEASKATDEQKSVLKRYGVTVDEINPETNKFADIMQRMADVSITATDAVKVFGSRAGTNIAQLASQIRTGQVDLIGLTEQLQASAGETADMYQTIGQTVTFQAKIAISALQDLLIETFETFAGPLRGLVEQVPKLLNEMTAALKANSGVISASLGDAFGKATSLLQDNSREIADTFVNLVKLTVQLAAAMAPLLGMLVAIATHAEELAVLLPAVFALTAVVKAIPLVQGLASAFGVAQVAVAAFGTTLTVSTGGLFAIAAAIGIVIAAVSTYILKVRAAKNETELLRAAQERMSAGAEAVAKAEESRLGPVLEEQQKRARELLESDADLTDAQRKRLESTLALTAESARLALNQGKLVETGGQLVSVETLVTELGADAVTVIKGQADAADEQAAAIGRQIAALDDNIRAYNEMSGSTAKAAEVQAIATKLGRDDIATMQDAQAAIEQLKAAQKEQANRARELRNEVSRSRQAALVEEKQAEVAAQRDQTGRARAATDDQIAEVGRAVDGIIALWRKLQDEAAQIRGDDFELAERDRLKEVEAVNAEFDKLVEARRKAGLDIASVEVERQRALEQLRDNFIKREERQAREEEEARGEARADELERQQGILDKVRDRGMTEAQRIIQEGEAALRDTDKLSADERFEIWQDYVIRANEAIASGLQDQESQQRGFLARLLGQVTSATQQLARIWDQAAGAVGSVSDAVQGLVERVSGFQFSLRGIVDEAIGAQNDARKAARDARKDLAEAQRALGQAKTPEERRAAERAIGKAEKRVAATGAEAAKGPAEFGVAAVDSMVGEALRFTEALAQSIGPIVEQLAARIPDLMQAIAEAIPVLAEALAATIPVVIQAVVDNLGPIVRALVTGAAEVVAAIILAIPGIVEAVLMAVPSIVQRLVEALPVLLTAIAGMIPGLIIVILENVPAIITAIIAAIPQVVVAIIAAIPTVVIEIVKALPRILGALFTGLARGLFQLIPRAIARMLKGVPRAVGGFIQGVIAAVPRIAGQLLKRIGEGIGNIARKIGQTIADFVKKAIAGPIEKEASERRGFGKVVGAAADVVKVTSKVVKGLLGGGGGGYSGVGYVPATMRMTVHQGERIVPANRNAVGVNGPAPAPAGAAQNFPALAATGGQGGSVDVAVLLEGRLVDGAMVTAEKRGHATGQKKAIRRRTGVSIGLQRGRFNAWAP